MLNIKCLGLVLFVAVTLVSCQEKDSVDQVCFDKDCFNVQVVSKGTEREKGLMFRESMPENEGMLFIFDRSFKHSFWMKNTLIALDIIWLDYNRQIVHIEENVPPCTKDPCPSYSPKKEAIYVLELNAGSIKKHALNSSKSAEFKITM